MKIYSYVVEHDLGFAPNPFHGVCSLATCKPSIRKSAQAGDIIIGTGPREATGFLVYWAKVSDVLDIDQYWHHPRFERKKPILNGSRMQQYGDNIYHSVGSGVVQVDSFHSRPGGIEDQGNKKRDVGKTRRVLICNEFLYLGKGACRIPQSLMRFVKIGPGHKCRFLEQEKTAMKTWLSSDNRRGLVGRPMHWL